MQYIYVSAACSDAKYSRLFEQGIIKTGQQSQKFNNLLIKGLAMNAEVYAVSLIPISVQAPRRKYKTEIEKIGNLQYIVIGILNFPIIRGVWNLLSLIKQLLRLIKKNKSCVLLCDAYSVSCSLATYIVSKIKRIKSVAIVTDLPQHLKVKKGIGSLVYRLMKRYDGYILLTEAMNEEVNVKYAPKLIIEGSCDHNMGGMTNLLENKQKPKVCLFAGSLTPNVGIELFTEAFIKVHPNDYEFHIYGAGPLETYFKIISQEHPCIKYFGCVPNSIVIQKQIEATILVNPRKTDAEYTKFSFPSKLIEYLASGTPVLTTRLAGIPKEYYPYLYTINGNNSTDYEEALINLFSKDERQLYSFGMDAKKFVLSEKNNHKQGEKIIRWVESELVVEK